MLRPDGDVKIDGLMLFTLFVGVIAFTLMYVWLVIHRQRTMAVEDALEDAGLDARHRAAPPRDAEPSPRASHRRRRRSVMEDAGFVFGSYVVTFGAVGAYALYVAATRAGVLADVAAARRRQALGREARSPDLSTIRPHPPAGTGRRRAGASALGCRSSCSALVLVAGGVIVTQFLALGRRLLLQRRRGRLTRRVRGRAAACACRARSTKGTVADARRRHRRSPSLQRRHAAGPLRGRSPGASSRSATRSWCTAARATACSHGDRRRGQALQRVRGRQRRPGERQPAVRRQRHERRDGVRRPCSPPA